MEGFQYFNNVFSLLDNENKKRLLEKVFSVQNIKEYYFLCTESNLILRIYANCTFYQFVFIFDDNDSDSCIIRKEKDRIVCYYVYVFDYLVNFDFSPFSFFVFLLLSSSELDVYHYFSIFL